MQGKSTSHTLFRIIASFFIVLLQVTAVSAQEGSPLTATGLSSGSVNLSSPQVQQLIQSLPGATPQQGQSFLLQRGQTTTNLSSDQLMIEQRDLGEKASSDTIDQSELSLSETSLSTIEQLYREQYNSPLSQSLTQYGYSLFKTTTQSISRLAVPSSSYLVGPGDTLHIRFWGSGLDADFTSVVSKEGTLDLPKLGIVPIAGTPLGKIEELLLREAEKYVQGVNINVVLTELRSVEIYVVGEVDRPGLHLVPAFTTVLSGLIKGGGIKKSGSLRNISLFRDGSKIRGIDLYSLLLHGSRDDDVVLKNGDVLFVPRLGPTAAIAGAAAQPAIYELTNEKSVADLLQLAGGVLPQSFTLKMLLRRFNNNQEFVVSDLDSRATDLDLT
ncbi:MAG: polysaccharide export protein, partial [Desulfobulbaceae bacterium]|nr:polysaccharide export protein [Desulfobulbaceae bacterium]